VGHREGGTKAGDGFFMYHCSGLDIASSMDAGMNDGGLIPVGPLALEHGNFACFFPPRTVGFQITEQGRRGLFLGCPSSGEPGRSMDHEDIGAWPRPKYEEFTPVARYLTTYLPTYPPT
jgi:hypothetical protein